MCIPGYLCYNARLAIRGCPQIAVGQIAQSVEQRIENPRVGSSILPLATTSYLAFRHSSFLGLLMSLIHLTPDELHPLLNDPSLLLIDIRNDHELVSGVLPGALHVPLGHLTSVFDQLPQNKKLVFYCRSGVRSISAGEFALAKGYADVSHLAGGILAWASAGLPIQAA